MSGEAALSSTITHIVSCKHRIFTPIQCFNLSRNSCTNSKLSFSLRCSSSNSSNSSSSPSPQGENQNKTVLDAFFLGKVLAEELNERIGSTTGEFLSTIGGLQAEQHKQVQDFQDEVLERAKKSKEKAAREAMEVQGTPSSGDVRAATDLQPCNVNQVS